MKATTVMGLDRTHRNNVLVVFLGEALWGIQYGLTTPSTVLTVLLAGAGAGATMVGAIGGIESGAWLLTQVLGIFLFQSLRNRKRQMILWHVLAIIPFLFAIAILIFLSGHLSPVVFRWGVLLCFCMSIAALGMVAAAWLDWLAHVFPVSIRGTGLGIGFFGFALAGVGGALLAGSCLTHFAQPRIFGFLYLAGGVLALLSMISYVFIDDRSCRQLPETAPLSFSLLTRYIRSSLRDATFRRFLAGRLLIAAGFTITPFITLHYIGDGGHLSPDGVVTYAALMPVGNAVGNLVFGRLGDRNGHRIGMLLGSATQIVALLLLLFTAGRLSCLLVFFGAGICFAASLVSHLNLLVETCPHEHRITHIMIGNAISGFAVLPAPILAGLVVEAWGLKVLFGVCLAISLAAFCWILLAVKEPRGMPRPA